MKIRNAGIIAAIALGGLVFCSTMATAQDQKEGKKRGGGPTIEQLTEALTLTDAQKPKVEAVLKDTQKKREELRDVPQDERREKGQAIRQEMDKKMKEILTPEQYEKYQAMPRGGRGGGGGQKKEGEKKN